MRQFIISPFLSCNRSSLTTVYGVEKHVSCRALSTVLAGCCQQHREYTELLLRRLLKLPSLKCPSSKFLLSLPTFSLPPNIPRSQFTSLKKLDKYDRSATNGGPVGVCRMKSHFSLACASDGAPEPLLLVYMGPPPGGPSRVI